jgi:hypothetical protein
MRYEGRITDLREQVRAVQLPERAEPFVLPPGFELWRDELRDGGRRLVLRADLSTWARHELGTLDVARLSLEDIFIACVGSASAQV